jgi:hypothetical protein
LVHKTHIVPFNRGTVTASGFWGALYCETRLSTVNRKRIASRTIISNKLIECLSAGGGDKAYIAKTRKRLIKVVSSSANELELTLTSGTPEATKLFRNHPRGIRVRLCSPMRAIKLPPKAHHASPNRRIQQVTIEYNCEWLLPRFSSCNDREGNKTNNQRPEHLSPPAPLTDRRDGQWCFI